METAVVRHESELASWELVARRPHPGLRRLVHGYSGYVESRAPSPLLRQEVPATVVPVIVNLGAPWRISNGPAGAGEVVYDSFVAGLYARSVYVAAAGPAACVQVDLTPLGAHLVLGLPMHELAGRVVGLEDVLPKGERSLPERLEDAGGWEERFAILDALLAARLAGAPAPDPDVARAWEALARTHGRVRVGELAERLGRSRRHLVARFREQVGLPPKTVARIFRFGRAVELMRARADVSLADLAFRCGYYDQPHLSREFRDLAGTSPAELARRLGPEGDVIPARGDA